jgi:hypothetical protein
MMTRGLSALTNLSIPHVNVVHYRTESDTRVGCCFDLHQQADWDTI